MSKFASRGTKTTHPIKSTQSGTLNHEGIPAFTRDSKSDLFLLGVVNFVSEDTFYESGDDRDDRYKGLVHSVTKEDPEWVAEFVRYLRGTANMRSVAIVTAAEYVRAGGPNGRKVVAAAILRADEPAEMLAYWMSNYGRSIPAAIKRGVADAAQRQYHERSFIKYDSANSAFRFADVIQLTHVKPKDEKQEALFKLALDSRYSNVGDINADVLPVVSAYRALHAQKDKAAARRALLENPDQLAESGMTWESLSSFGEMDAEAWEAIIPQMGYMALLRNLRNFDEAGISDKAANAVIAKLSDPEEVAKSRQLIYRFYAAYVNAPSLRWGHALETAMDLACQNIPVLGGKTLVLVDTSASMSSGGYSARSTMAPVQAAALFGAALAKSGQNVDLRMFADSVAEHRFSKGGSVLKTADSLVKKIGRVGHGTNIAAALDSWTDHDRVVLLTDMQTQHYVSRTQTNTNDYWGYSRTGGHNIPKNVPIYGFNLAGYKTTVVDTENNMYEFGGLTDSTFSMLKSIEDGRNSNWPWQQ